MAGTASFGLIHSGLANITIGFFVQAIRLIRETTAMLTRTRIHNVPEMDPHWRILLLTVALCSRTALVTASTNSPDFVRGVFNKALQAQLAGILQKNQVPGYSVAIVCPSDERDVEFWTWGNATEDGHPMTAQVCTM
jgi:hypothetical protein